MSALYPLRWLWHPDAKEEQKRIQLYLDSFLESGEVEKTQMLTYKITGKALVSLEQYELDKGRYDANLRLQLGMLVTSILLVILTVIQSGLLRFPAIFDFTK